MSVKISVWTGVTRHVWACVCGGWGGVVGPVLPFVQQTVRAVVCQLVSYLDCSPPGSGRVSEPGLDHTEPVGVGPPCSLTDGPGLGGCLASVACTPCSSHSDTLTLFVAASRSNPEQSPRRRIKPRVVLEEKLIFSIVRCPCSEWSSAPPRGLSLAVPSHFSSKPACQIGWSVPVFCPEVEPWSADSKANFASVCFRKCCEYAHLNDDDHTFSVVYFYPPGCRVVSLQST